MDNFKNVAKSYMEMKLSEKVEYPHMMYDPETGDEVEVKTPEEHDKLAAKGYTHKKPDLEEAKAGKGKITLDMDWIANKAETREAEKKFKIKVKFTGSGTADVTGEKKDLLAMMKSDIYGYEDEDVEDIYPEIYESKEEEEPKKKMEEDKERYQKFFQAALKKFGVSSPAELEGDKKKEFFDYVDKNYKADNESD